MVITRSYLIEAVGQVAALEAGVVQDPQLGREPLGLLDPVEDEARGHDGQRRRTAAVGVGGPRPPLLQHGQHLDGLAQAHVVGQATAEAEVLQEMQPAQPGLLIGPQLAGESLRLVDRPDAVERSQVLAEPGEGRIDGDLLLGRQQGVQEQRLRRAKADRLAFRLAQLGHRGEAPSHCCGKMPREPSFSRT